MGKKSKSNNSGSKKSPATATDASKKDLPGWHDALPKTSVESVLELPQVDHGWLCTLIQPNGQNPSHPYGILAILDITNRVRGEGTMGRFMNVGPCPNPDTEGDDIAKAIMATMMAPSKTNMNPRDDPAYFQPRRPAWVLLEKDLEPCVELVAEILAAVNVVVKLNTPEALAGGDSADESVAEDNNGRMATWDVGLAMGATAENVNKLSQVSDQVWKCSMTMLQDESTGAKECFMAVEDVTEGLSEEQSYPLGVGPCPAATVNPDGMVRALFATMLSPRAKEGGYGEARRPGRVILDKPLEPWLEHVQNKVQVVGVSVEI